MNTLLLPEDFTDDAAKLGCEVEAIRAVAQVESSGSGFCPDNFPKTLFEGHYFSKFTGGKFDKDYPTISYPKWTKAYYGKGWEAERQRLTLAMSLDRTSAVMSASWGTFQIMGAHFTSCGFKTAQQFVNAMCKDANAHLEAFTAFILDRGLADELRDKRWDDFARLYNGPSYKLNDYATKMAKAYSKLKGL